MYIYSYILNFSCWAIKASLSTQNSLQFYLLSISSCCMMLPNAPQVIDGHRSLCQTSQWAALHTEGDDCIAIAASGTITRPPGHNLWRNTICWSRSRWKIAANCKGTMICGSSRDVSNCKQSEKAIVSANNIEDYYTLWKVSVHCKP